MLQIGFVNNGIAYGDEREQWRDRMTEDGAMKSYTGSQRAVDCKSDLAGGGLDRSLYSYVANLAETSKIMNGSL